MQFLACGSISLRPTARSSQSSTWPVSKASSSRRQRRQRTAVLLKPDGHQELIRQHQAPRLSHHQRARAGIIRAIGPFGRVFYLCLHAPHCRAVQQGAKKDSLRRRTAPIPPHKIIRHSGRATGACRVCEACGSRRRLGPRRFPEKLQGSTINGRAMARVRGRTNNPVIAVKRLRVPGLLVSRLLPVDLVDRVGLAADTGLHRRHHVLFHPSNGCCPPSSAHPP